MIGGSKQFTIDTADNTTREGDDTFYVRIRTRGMRIFYYPVKSTLVCGKEKVYYPGDLQFFKV